MGNDLGQTTTQAMVFTGSLWTGGDTAGTPLLGSSGFITVTPPDGTSATTLAGQTLDPRFLNDWDMVAGYHIGVDNLGSSGVPATTGVLDNNGWHYLGSDLVLAGLTSGVTTTTLTGATVTLSPPVAYGFDVNNQLWWAHQTINLAGVTSWVESPIRVQDPASVTGNPVKPTTAQVRANDRLEMIIGDHRVIRNGTFVDLNSRITEGWRVTDTRDINHSGVILADATRTNLAATQPVLLVPLPALRVDSNSDGIIDANDPLPTASQPFQHWLNDGTSAGLTGGNGTPVPDYASGTVNGTNDLNNYFPVFLDIQNFVSAMPPGKGYTYWLSQADEALDLVYTNLTQQTAFAYQGGLQTTGFGPDLNEAPGAAGKEQVTAGGVRLNATFLSLVQSSTTNQGVLLFEGRTPSTAPLVLTVYDGNNNQVVQVSLQLSLGARILLLLHGMDSNVTTWDTFVNQVFGTSSNASATIISGTMTSLQPQLTPGGVRCYRLQFGFSETASTPRTGLEGLTTSNAPGAFNGVNIPYLNDPMVTCGDFETFDELGQELDDTITQLQNQYPNCQIMLLGHSRGGLAARDYLQSPYASRSAIVALLTTSTPHLGSRMGQIYDWLAAHGRTGTTSTGTVVDINRKDWATVDFLKNIKPPMLEGTTTFVTVVGHPKDFLDVRRPVIHDMADNSAAITNLNLPAQVANLPSGITYGEIIHQKVDFGQLATAPNYSVIEFDAGDYVFPRLSKEARSFLLNGYAANASQVVGDGLIPAWNQGFTQLPGFSGATVPRVVNRSDLVTHSGAPLQFVELLGALKAIRPQWFP